MTRTTPAVTGPAPVTAPGHRRTVLLLCFAVLVFDGYDLIVYGAVLPELLRYEPWDLRPAEAGAIGSYAAGGMLLGALGAGALAGRLGHRRILLVGMAWFSTAMAACALAPTAWAFGLFRVLGGIGLGAVMPTAVALTAEHSEPRHRGRSNALMFSGYSVGGIIAAALAVALLPELSFRALFWAGAAPVLFLPVLARHLPGRAVPHRVSRPHGPGAFRELLRPPHRVPALLFALISFFGLLLVYGLNAWLPQIMRSVGYPTADSLFFLVVLNTGAIAGTLVFGPLGDRVGMRGVIALAFGLAAVSILLLSAPRPMPVLHALTAVAGFGTIGTQILVNGHIAAHFPAPVRTAALSWSLGVGRLGAIAGPAFGGLIAASGAGVRWNFYAFAVPAALTAGLVALLPARAATP
ncbi:MFS transporter [Streptomyces luteocolor]|uniref:MFS transporter n=1 Tax=Streptomyces luteocolor TaxID=285500 RepID=UPI000B2CC1F9|nr:aromatic acid/H+ symport family MFS transporter [Streptomyces luteocolor]